MLSLIQIASYFTDLILFQYTKVIIHHLKYPAMVSYIFMFVYLIFESNLLTFLFSLRKRQTKIQAVGVPSFFASKSRRMYDLLRIFKFLNLLDFRQFTKTSERYADKHCIHFHTLSLRPWNKILELSFSITISQDSRSSDYKRVNQFISSKDDLLSPIMKKSVEEQDGPSPSTNTNDLSI